MTIFLPYDNLVTVNKSSKCIVINYGLTKKFLIVKSLYFYIINKNFEALNKRIIFKYYLKYSLIYYMQVVGKKAELKPNELMHC